MGSGIRGVRNKGEGKAAYLGAYSRRSMQKREDYVGNTGIRADRVPQRASARGKWPGVVGRERLVIKNRTSIPRREKE